MAAKKRYGSTEITAVWFAPEQIRSERIQAAVDDGASAQDVADLAASLGNGEYREWLGEELVEGVKTPKYGELLVWHHPLEDGEPLVEEGWFEKFTGDPADYQPVVTDGEEA